MGMSDIALYGIIHIQIYNNWERESRSVNKRHNRNRRKRTNWELSETVYKTQWECNANKWTQQIKKPDEPREYTKTKKKDKKGVHVGMS